MEEDKSLVSLAQYVASNSKKPTEVTDLVLRRLPDAIALWRSEQEELRGHIVEEMIKIDASTGIPIIVSSADGDAQPVEEIDDVKRFGEIAAKALSVLPYTNHRVMALVECCRGGKYENMGEVMIAVERRKSSGIYILLIAIIAIFVAILLWLK